MKRFALLALFFPSLMLAQSAVLTSSTKTLFASGGMVVLTARATYEGMPRALGWTIVVPATWRLVSVAGPNAPAVVPEAGTTGMLEFAYTTVPISSAQFSVTVEYPAGTSSATIAGSAIVQIDGAPNTVATSPLELRSHRAPPEPNAKR